MFIYQYLTLISMSPFYPKRLPVIIPFTPSRPFSKNFLYTCLFLWLDSRLLTPPQFTRFLSLTESTFPLSYTLLGLLPSSYPVKLFDFSSNIPTSCLSFSPCPLNPPPLSPVYYDRNSYYPLMTSSFHSLNVTTFKWDQFPISFFTFLLPLVLSDPFSTTIKPLSSTPSPVLLFTYLNSLWTSHFDHPLPNLHILLPLPLQYLCKVQKSKSSIYLPRR